MTKLFCIVVVVLVVVPAGLVFGSGVDNKTNWSTGYLRTMNRNAVTDSPDAALYNHAGIVKLG